MAKRKQIYKCDTCGNIIEVLHGGDGELICCGESMKLFEEKTADQSKEKHVPVIELMDGSIKVKVGSTPHPMEEKHFIEWIEIFDKEKSYRHYLNPGELPETVFKSLNKGVVAREYCNVHGLWKS
ncbi:MAG: desulfoferrodoxin [Proteobacteria bacterium]|nr:desulfoferrodoxin [Pseudomonadota bacterium]MBU1582779.1 desulfoferrodoxin [Pseudomonadota bacterium]MBU2455728.1 desulfoferrodoxin [Pseudomonadota bacterium]MBU2631908.1 desulfoferrodoxin [Pseudomonadota bacterium]